MPSASAARVRRRQRAVPSAGISGLPVEVVEDHPAVVQHIAVGQAQCRDLAQRVVLVQRGVGADRAELAVLQGHAVQLTGFVQQHHHFAHVG
ncbi:hypothetical protein D3C84_335030 [compost metagenome]